MIEAGIGRLLVASLHQSIADLLPTRLDFYESWLNPAGLRDGRIGLAPLAAVLSFLRQEDAYHLIMARAGEYTAEWVMESSSSMRRSVVRGLPQGLRLSIALRIGSELIRQTYKASRASARVRRGEGAVEIRGSIFCEVRELTPEPMCDFYAAAYRRLLAEFDLETVVEIARCRAASDGSACTLVVRIAPADGPTGPRQRS